MTGLCECVSVIGPLLGGGHSMLQSAYGFSADNLISARLVLEDGSALSVSKDSQPDLFWALAGAGHNFGIVSSFEVKVYDVADTWTMGAFAFTQDKLEAVFETWNQLEEEFEDPGVVVLNGVFGRNDEIDSEHVSLSIRRRMKENNTPG